ncbi:MAG: hypothetical protein GY796_34135 [Chloroflexi bacterium]|nr:hypothetical protein [Chloroflexota bacterium]
MDLIQIRFPDPSPDVFTLESFQFAFKISGLSATAIQYIEQSRRINLSDALQLGLNYFHTGLIYLYEGEILAADNHFKRAWDAWAREVDQSLFCLASLGRGYALEIAYRYEGAMKYYYYAQNYHAKIRLRNYAHNDEQQQRMQAFKNSIEDHIKEAQKNLRQLMQPVPETAVQDEQIEQDSETVPNNEEDHPPEPTTSEPPAAEEERGSDEETVPPPISNINHRNLLPILGHVKTEREYQWYEVDKRLSDEFLPFVQPGDWLLVYTQPEQTVAAEQERPIMVLFESEIDGTILLKPHPSTARPMARQRIHLKPLTMQTGTFILQNGKAIFTETEHQITMNLEDIFGVVMGLWRPVAQMSENP